MQPEPMRKTPGTTVAQLATALSRPTRLASQEVIRLIRSVGRSEETLDREIGEAFAIIERIATGFRFTEGPVYYGDGRYLLFSDIPNDALVRWDEITGAVATLRQPAGTAPRGTMSTRPSDSSAR